VPHRAPPAATELDRVSPPALALGRDHASRGLPGAPGLAASVGERTHKCSGGGESMSAAPNSPTSTISRRCCYSII
jgi:hypothetical protein